MNGYIIQTRKKNPLYKFIPEEKIAINRNTPVGESADFYWLKPNNGRKLIDPVAQIEDGEAFYKISAVTEELLQFCEERKRL